MADRRDRQAVGLLVADTGRDVCSHVALRAVQRIGQAGGVEHRSCPTTWGQHLLGGHAAQFESAHCREGRGAVAAVAVVVATVVAITTMIVMIVMIVSFGFGYANRHEGTRTLES